MKDSSATLAQAVTAIFGDACKVAWLSGSFAYGGATKTSDLDVVLLFDRATPVPATPELFGRIKKFVDVYLEAHRVEGLQPDCDFPGEYLNENLVNQCLLGRGFTISESRQLTMPEVSHTYWTDDWRHWFRAWASMLAFSRFLVGDRQLFEWIKSEGWMPILKFILLKTDARTENAVFEGLVDFGLKPHYRDFRALEAPYIRNAMARLERDGFVGFEDELYVPKRENLLRWHDETVTRNVAPPNPGDLLLNLEQTAELAAYANSRM